MVSMASSAFIPAIFKKLEHVKTFKMSEITENIEKITLYMENTDFRQKYSTRRSLRGVSEHSWD